MSNESIPTSQKVWQEVAKGYPADALQVRDVPVPKLKDGEVLVNIKAAALNPVSYKLMLLLPNFMAKRPHGAEHDFAGVVADGNGTTYKNGDEVFGICPVDMTQKTGQGTLASYIAVPVTHITSKPSSISFTEAAGLSLTGLTATQGLAFAKIEPGQSVFINGGSSSVGATAIQICKAKGCKVSVSCSGKNVEHVKSLGADEIFDYTKGPLQDQLSPATKYNVFFDTIGNVDLFISSPKYLQPNGMFVSVGPAMKSAGDLPRVMWEVIRTSFIPTWLGGTPRKYKMIMMNPTKENLDSLRDLVNEGKLRPVVDSVYPFDEALKAYERIMTGRAKGKVIVTVP